MLKSIDKRIVLSSSEVETEKPIRARLVAAFSQTLYTFFIGDSEEEVKPAKPTKKGKAKAHQKKRPAHAMG